MSTRDERKRTFEQVADRYAAHRPGYPDAAFEALERLSGVHPPAELLEIGCGPGQATVPLAERGFRIHAIELGATLAALTRERTRGLPVTVDVAPFETATLPDLAFDLAVSASAFHWLDRPTAYARLARAIRPGGALAVLWNFHTRHTGDAATEALRPCYERFAPELIRRPDAKPLPYSVRDLLPSELTATGHFTEPQRWETTWERAYDAAGYQALLGTYSDHVALPADVRERLFGCIADAIERTLGGRLVRRFVTQLFVSTRHDRVAPDAHR